MIAFFKGLLFFLVPITALLFSGLVLPPTPNSSRSLLFAGKKKDSLLMHTPSPRIIFVGGSNLSFGLDSFVIRDSLKLNPVNTGLHAGIGVKYMLENTRQYLEQGDIVVIAFEYEHFYQAYDAVSDDLLRTIFDVFPEKLNLLSLKQDFRLIEYIPRFSLTKLKPTEYWGYAKNDWNSVVHRVDAFNKFGDVDAHWTMGDVNCAPAIFGGAFNEDVVRKIWDFESAAKEKGVTVYLTFPSLDETSFNTNKEKVTQVESVLRKYGFKLLGNTERYVMPRDLMFDNHYHLNKTGLEYRTALFIEDFKGLVTLEK